MPTDELPLVEELPEHCDPKSVFLALSGKPHCLFLDSAQRGSPVGRYSFVSADPFDLLELPVGSPNIFDEFQQRLARFESANVEGLPPFQGGAAGVFSYELNHAIERLPKPQFDEFQAPAIAIGFYDVVIAFDHEQNRAWIISQGFPETEPESRTKQAKRRLEQFKGWLNDSSNQEGSQKLPSSGNCNPVSRKSLAPQFPINGFEELTSDFSHVAYLDAVQTAVEYIRAGDVFQVNLSQRLLHPATDDSVSLYLRLRERNPAPFAGYFDLGKFQIVSASPERFVRLHDRNVETRPIKGTRQRSTLPEADLFAGDDLEQSEKDRAENVMIVDLMRNDLSRVCEPDSVQVTQLCGLEVYEYVQHLVSVVTGRLRQDASAIDLIQATFPGGSITGAPKVRAMEIIAELEPTARGPYCGSLGYVGFNGAMDLSILIRTITAGRGWWQIPVGGGIVAQSSPQAEYEETWHKATGLLKALT